MTSQILGYYLAEKETLLKEFDSLLTLAKDFLINHFGPEFAGQIQIEIRQEYEKLIPEIPYIQGFRGKPLNIFLLVTAQELAVFKGMNKFGKSAKEVWKLCHEILLLRLAKIPKWKIRLYKFLLFSPFSRMVLKKRAKKNEKAILGDFEIEYLIGRKEDDFDFGVNYLRCGNLNFAIKHGGEEFAPYICMSDIALSNIFQWGLTRTQTLADGCQHCDFRFKKGAETKITSKTLEVQETIDNIRKEKDGSN